MTNNAERELLPCQECGMPVAAGEYHPYAACLMFRGCHSSVVVRANLSSVARAQASSVPDGWAFVGLQVKVNRTNTGWSAWTHCNEFYAKQVESDPNFTVRELFARERNTKS